MPRTLAPSLAAFTFLALCLSALAQSGPAPVLPKQSAAPDPVLSSSLHVIAVDPASPRDRIVYIAHAHFQAPNWTRDGRSLLFNQDGRLYRIPVAGGTPEPIATGAATSCSGSHGFSPGGQWLAISCLMPPDKVRHVYVVPATGGAPRQLTQAPGANFHSWSPDGKTILFTRSGHGANNIYAIPAAGGPEQALTHCPDICDDPDYSASGKFIYFNSNRTGTMQIWRMNADGSNPSQVTHDGFWNYTPHPSPNGKWIVFISYDKPVTGHPSDRAITLRLLSIAGNSVRALVTLTGGNGTMNVPNWSPDSSRLAFVSYRILPAEETNSPR